MMTKLLPLSRVCAFLVILAAAAFVALTPARADSWALPRVETFEADQGLYRFTVTPRPLDSQLAYFEEKIAELEGQPPAPHPGPTGVLERRDGEEWIKVWDVPLANDVAPVSALVAPDGSHVVTFDNWHSVGYGENVIVIYDVGGALVRSLTLTELLGEDYIEALPRSVSSVRWKKAAQYSPLYDQLHLDVLVPKIDREQETETVRWTIGLRNGSIVPPDPEAWQAAQAKAGAVKAVRDEAERERIAYLTNPIVAPESQDMRDWNRYLSEAFARRVDDFTGYPSAHRTILFPSDHPRFEESVKRLRNKVQVATENSYSEDYPAHVALAAIGSDAAMKETLAKELAKLPPGSLRYAEFYLVAASELAPDYQAIFKDSGARVIIIDPRIPIPQRPERVPGSPEKAAFEKAEQDRRTAEIKDVLDEL